MSVESFLRYMQYERGVSPRTLVSYRNDLFQFTAFLQQQTPPSEPQEADLNSIRRWVVSLMEQGLSARSVHRKISALRTFYTYALRQGIVSSDPTRSLRLPRAAKELPFFVREREMDQLLDDTDFDSGFRGSRDRLILLMLYETGLRCAELISLKDAAVDIESGVLRVIGKRNRERMIPFGGELPEEIMRYRSLRARQIGDNSEYFFVRENGAPLYPKLVYRIVHESLGRVTSMQKRSPHVLRHTFATVLLNNGASINSVKELLGHRSLASTEVYTHVSLEELKKNYKQAHPRAE